MIYVYYATVVNYSCVNSLDDFALLLITMTQQSSPPKPHFSVAIHFNGTSVFLFIILQKLGGKGPLPSQALATSLGLCACALIG